MKSINMKLVAMYLILVFFVMTVSGTFMVMRIKLQETTRYIDTLKNFADVISEEVVQRYDRNDFSDAMTMFVGGGMTTVTASIDSQSRQESLLHGYILNEQGKTIASTDAARNPYVEVQQFSNDAIISAMTGAPKSSLGKDMGTGGTFNEWFNWAAPVVKESDSSNYIIFTRTDAKPLSDNLADIAATFFITALLALFLTGVLGFLFAKTISAPISRLTKSAKEIAGGNLNQRIQVYGSDEIGQLTESFNNMSEELKIAMAAMRSEKNKMEVILQNMTDGVLAYDGQGALLHANVACKELLDFEDIEAVPFGEMMSRLNADAEIPRDIKEGALALGDKFVRASFSAFDDKDDGADGMIVVLQDITKLKRLDNMRKEFVANVSHEIRTPITTIKSYAETLLDGAFEDVGLAERFLSTIVSESDRMALLAEDLLELSRFDNKRFKFEFKDVNLIAILKRSITQNSVIALQKKQSVKFESPETDYWILGDASRINQVFTNVISNAVKYGREGGEIIISAEATPEYYTIYIKDFGIGIPKEDLERVFERFYRVDKARSRAMGGTGLGLAIAKDIMEAHNGEIHANSGIGDGTTMTLRFKRPVA
ncbi:MAG: cell wall metabolism sensor histidine kinase WalK [Clostridiales bacterium]|nr:cell wall metabolism sensor histidine kinase WalK [Clostridiales bacterium]